MKENRRLIRNTGLISIGNISTKLVSFFLLPLYTSILSTAQYGTVDYIISISTFCVPFVTGLMDESMFRFLIDADDQDSRTNIISVAIVISAVGAVIVSVICFGIFALTHNLLILAFLCYVLSAVISTLFSALLRGIGRTDWFVLYNFVTGIITVALNVLFIAVMHWGVYGMLYSFVMAQLLVSIYTAFKIKIWTEFSLRLISYSRVRVMLKYSLPMIPNSISWSIVNLSDRLVIMNVLGASASGLYAVAYKFPTLMDTVYGFFYQSWKESSARALKAGNEESFFQSVYVYLINSLFSILILMISFMPLVFHFMVNSSYHSALVYVPILLTATFCSDLSGFFGGIFTAHKNTWILGTTTVWSAIINLALNVLLIKRLGIYAAAFATLLSSYFIYQYRREKVKKMVSLHYPFNKMVVNALIFGAVLVLFYTGTGVSIGIGCIISLFYSVLLNASIVKVIFKRLLRKQI
ncbi:lipopolysaccharide biosynthesis protein [Lacticaseibacillus paracasei]|uniref:lipopolysaccharide biosynthesis protein n=1 Tax=Lacticaseibacillus paracasei TaxID=1597 RepID=UPI0039827E4A